MIRSRNVPFLAHDSIAKLVSKGILICGEKQLMFRDGMYFAHFTQDGLLYVKTNAGDIPYVPPKEREKRPEIIEWLNEGDKNNSAILTIREIPNKHNYHVGLALKSAVYMPEYHFMRDFGEIEHAITSCIRTPAIRATYNILMDWVRRPGRMNGLFAPLYDNYTYAVFVPSTFQQTIYLNTDASLGSYVPASFDLLSVRGHNCISAALHYCKQVGIEMEKELGPAQRNFLTSGKSLHPAEIGRIIRGNAAQDSAKLLSLKLGDIGTVEFHQYQSYVTADQKTLTLDARNLFFSPSFPCKRSTLGQLMSAMRASHIEIKGADIYHEGKMLEPGENHIETGITAKSFKQLVDDAGDPESPARHHRQTGFLRY